MAIDTGTVTNLRLRRRPWRRLTRWTASRMPKGLYARSLIIIIAPMVLLQGVLAFVFMERHWQTVTQRLSNAVTADIAAVIDLIETFPDEIAHEQIADIARERLNLNIALLPPDPFPPANTKPFFSILDNVSAGRDCDPDWPSVLDRYCRQFTPA